MLPDLDPFGVEGLSMSTFERALQRSAYGLRLVGYPTAALQELFDRPHRPPSLTLLMMLISSEMRAVLEELPEWQNPDGEALLQQLGVRRRGNPPVTLKVSG